MLEKGFTPNGSGPGALDSPRLVCQLQMVSEQLQRSLRKCSSENSMVMHGKQVYSPPLLGSTFEMMPSEYSNVWFETHRKLCPAHRSSRRSRFFFPRGQLYLACGLCWLVSPPKRREASLPVAHTPPSPVPPWVVSALALGMSCPSALLLR